MAFWSSSSRLTTFFSFLAPFFPFPPFLPPFLPFFAILKVIRGSNTVIDLIGSFRYYNCLQKRVFEYEIGRKTLQKTFFVIKLIRIGKNTAYSGRKEFGQVDLRLSELRKWILTVA